MDSPEGALASAPTDFEFMTGTWTVQHRRLVSRLSGCTDWVRFSGTSHTRPVLGGAGNVEDNWLNSPDGAYRAVALRTFDPERNQWAIWWLDARQPWHLDIPVKGGFHDLIGTFFAEDVLDGQPIRVRFTWNATDPTQPQWDQAFSADHGESWETNWQMTFSRAGG